MNVNKKVTPQTQKPIRFLMLDIIRRDWKQNANMLMCIQVWLMLKHIMTFIFMAMKQKQKKSICKVYPGTIFYENRVNKLLWQRDMSVTSNFCINIILNIHI